MTLIKNVADVAVVLRATVLVPGQEVDVEELLGSDFQSSAFYQNALFRGDIKVIQESAPKPVVEEKVTEPVVEVSEPVEPVEQAETQEPVEVKEAAPAKRTRKGSAE